MIIGSWDGVNYILSPSLSLLHGSWGWCVPCLWGKLPICDELLGGSHWYCSLQNSSVHCVFSECSLGGYVSLHWALWVFCSLVSAIKHIFLNSLSHFLLSAGAFAVPTCHSFQTNQYTCCQHGYLCRIYEEGIFQVQTRKPGSLWSVYRTYLNGGF